MSQAVFDYMARRLMQEENRWRSALMVPQTNACLETAYIDTVAKKVQYNNCYVRLWDDGTVEWIERRGGMTTVTHHSFAHPHFWRFPAGHRDGTVPMHERTDYDGCIDGSKIRRYPHADPTYVGGIVHPSNYDYETKKLVEQIRF